MLSKQDRNTINTKTNTKLKLTVKQKL